MKEWFRLTRPQLYLQVLHWTKVKQKRESTHKCKTKKTKQNTNKRKTACIINKITSWTMLQRHKHTFVNKVRGREGVIAGGKAAV